jgi:hypothetical protein
MFGKKNALLLEEAEAKIRQQQEKLDWYQRHYEKQQGYIEELYDLVGELTRQFGVMLQCENLERLVKHPFLQENSSLFLDLHLLFSTKLKKGKNVTCYFGKELEELKRRFQDRDFKNSANIHLTERLTIGELTTLLKERLWRKSVVESLQSIRSEKKFDEKPQ